VSLHPHDRQAVLELRAYDAQACPRGHHESDVEKYAPSWVRCELCAAMDAMEKKGPPGPGNHIVLLPIEEAERRAAWMADDDE
jgi:hypothetical protein